MTLKRFDHQIHSANFMAKRKRCFNHNDPGTGKTITAIDAFTASHTALRALVLCPLSILQVAWGNDIEKASEYSYAIAHGNAKKRETAFASGATFVLSNHDAVKWISEDLSLLEGFSHIIVDEYRAFKTRTSQRSKALRTLTSRCEYLWLMSGSPNTLSLCDLWYPALLIDGGKRLGKNFWEFRAQVCSPKQVGPRAEHIQWIDRPGAEVEVATQLKDISIRYALTDCIDMPDRIIRKLTLPMPTWLESACKEFAKHAYLELEGGDLNAINAGAKEVKLLQMLSGAVYDFEGKPVKIHNERYELVLDMVEERRQTIVGFNWKHQLDSLKAEATKRGVTFGVINGDVPLNKRTQIVDEFQRGELQVLFLHPQAAGHGLTLTNAQAVIWCSPTKDAEHFIQLNARVYRNGQKQVTEVICIAYEDSPETAAYDILEGKVSNVTSLLGILAEFSKSEKKPPCRQHL